MTDPTPRQRPYPPFTALIRARERLGLTQADLARRLGMPPQTLVKVELGDTAPETHVIRLARALGLTPNDLLLPGAVPAPPPPNANAAVDQLRHRLAIIHRGMTIDSLPAAADLLRALAWDIDRLHASIPMAETGRSGTGDQGLS